MTWLGTMFFKQGSRGWTEQWYQAGGGDSGPALLSLNRLAAIRRTGLGVNTQLVCCRVSDVAVRGDSRILFRNDQLPASAFGQGNASDIASSVWYCQVEADDLVRRQLMLRGMPDRWYGLGKGNVDPEQPRPQPGLIVFIDKFLTALQTEGWGVYGIRAGANRLQVRIIDVGRDAITGQLILYPLGADGPFPNVGDTIRIYQQHLSTKIKSSQQVAAVDGTSVTLWQTVPAGTTYGGGASFRTQGYEVIVPRTINLVRVSKRKTGRAFFVPAGRRARAR